MSDVYVYFYFTGQDGPPGKNTLSARQATLETIKGKGEPFMESQIVVDHTELDADGFLIVGVGNHSDAVNDLTAQIDSLELRAASRDGQALQLSESSEGQDKYMLHLESRELRGQSRRLQKQRDEVTADELAADPQNFVQCSEVPATG